MSGPAASWGIHMKWGAEKAAEEINRTGGIKVAGKAYKVQVIAYDNKYNATEGAKTAQLLFNRDGVDFVIGSLGTAPTQALQSISEREGKLLFTTAFGKALKGPKFPLTFTQLNTPVELLPQMYGYIKKVHPNVKTVALLNPNDATGQDTEPQSQKLWKSLGVEVVSSDWFERSTTEFQPIVSKFARLKPDIIEITNGPPTTAGVVYKELAVQGWKGVKIVVASSGERDFVTSGGPAVEGTYVGNAADMTGQAATDLQKRLNKLVMDEIQQPLSPLTLCTWDSMMALKAGIEKAQSVDPKKVAAALPTIVFESSWGPAAFGGAENYGTPQQMLIPTVISQIQNGKPVEVLRVLPKELEEKLKTKK
jgi:branched-chain amino acid transport system substrate-binding protein